MALSSFTGWLNQNCPSIANKVNYLRRQFVHQSGALSASPAKAMTYYNNIPPEVDEDDIYATEDGYMEVAFWYHRLGEGNWRIYIFTDIDWNGRATGAHPTHRYYDDAQALHYICYDRTIPTKAEARDVSADWADLASRYIRTGTPFQTGD
jgi:hypothetical protein